jgi:sugar phosphate isomerase/epimerase
MQNTPAAWPTLPSLPATGAWRLGISISGQPSDIPADVERLAGAVHAIELALARSGETVDLPDVATTTRLATLAARRDVLYTVHMPTDRQLGSSDASERADALLQILDIVDTLQPLTPHAYILSPGGLAADASPARLAAWQSDLTSAIAQVLSSGLDPRRLALTNLDFPFDWCAPLIEPFDLSVCIDTGCLWRQGLDAAAHFERWASRTRVIRLDCTPDGDTHQLGPFVKGLASYCGVVTLGAGSYEDTVAAINTLGKLVGT